MELKSETSRHYRSFWPLMIIFVVAAVLAGVVYWFQITLSQEEDINSMVITIQPRKHEIQPETKTSTKRPAVQQTDLTK